MFETDEKWLKLLLSMLPTLQWLSAAEPVDVHSVPCEHIAALKQLDGVGLVYKRNARSYGLQKERLKKLITRISERAPESSPDLLDELFNTVPIEKEHSDRAASACGASV